MKICIIDIGTQSIKHSIFELKDTQKILVFYKKYSEANLGEQNDITNDALERNIRILQACVLDNKNYDVEKIIITGTDILRKAQNAPIFMARVASEIKSEIQVLSHEKEAELLYKGLNVIAPKMTYVGLNVGGGSTEVVCVGDGALKQSIRIPFGVKLLREMFLKDGVCDWVALDAYLALKITVPPNVCDYGFITGVLDFTQELIGRLSVPIIQLSLPNHPFCISFQDYEAYVYTLRTIPLASLYAWYTKDQKFCDNVAFGQSIYLAILRKMVVKYVVPSNNDLTDGLIVD